MIDPYELGLKCFEGSTGEWVLCVCPYHDDHTPSAGFNVNTGIFHCFACHKVSNAFKLSKKLGGSVVNVASIINRRQEHNLDWMCFLNAPLALNNEYLESRGIEQKTVRHYGILATEFCIVFPLKDEKGQSLGIQIRTYTGKPKRYMIFGYKPPVWPYDVFCKRKSKQVVLVEGIFGALRMQQFGFETYASLGTQFKKSALNVLNGKEITAFFNHDYAGVTASYRLVKELGARFVYPGGEADTLNRQGIRHMLQKATFNASLLEKYIVAFGGEKLIKSYQRHAQEY